MTAINYLAAAARPELSRRCAQTAAGPEARP